MPEKPEIHSKQHAIPGLHMSQRIGDYLRSITIFRLVVVSLREDIADTYSGGSKQQLSADAFNQRQINAIELREARRLELLRHYDKQGKDTYHLEPRL